MVDITRCEKCGKVIPALDTGCAWCDAEAARSGFHEDDWLPLSIRMLLWMFLANLVLTAALAGLTLATADGLKVQLGAALRLLVAVTTLWGILGRRSWARPMPFLFLGLEAMWFAGWSAGWLAGAGWMGSWAAPVWNLLFVFLFLREDVRVHLDPRRADRHEVGRLLDEFGRRGR